MNKQELLDLYNLDLDELLKISSQYIKNDIEFCSLINARNGKCSQNCRYCAQSSHYNTNIESYIEVMHTLFALEEEYGATLVCEPGATYITFPAGSDLRSRLSDWDEVFSKLKDGSMTKEEYEEWKNTYPKSLIYNKK